MSPFPSTLPSELLLEFDYKCCYCQRRMGLSDHVFFESDHIYPASKRGSDGLENRAPACRECNQKKSNKTESKDPVTEKYVKLFDPKRDVWSEHFEVSQLSGVIVGKSPKGRATVNLLSLDERPRDATDLFRDIEFVTEGGDILSQMALLRHLRLSCDFENVINLGKILFNDENVKFAKCNIEMQLFVAIQIIETYFTRSRDVTDILNGINITLWFKKYFLKHWNKGIDISIFDNLIASFCKQLISLQHPNSTLLKNIMLNSLVRTTEKNLFLKSISKLAWRLKLNATDAANDLKFVIERLEYIDDFFFADPVKFIYLVIDLLDIVSMFPALFKNKSTFIIENSIKANMLIKTHFSFDVTLLSLLQRRILKLKMNYDLSQETLNKNELIAYARKHMLFNEIRQIAII